MAKAVKTAKKPKVVKQKTEPVEKVKVASIFDHLSNVTFKKMPWSELSEGDRKSFSPFMNNRLLSMNQDYIELVNDLQRLTLNGPLTPEFTYKLFLDILPKDKQFNKYIKGKKDNAFHEDLIDLICKHFSISRKESVEYLELYFDGRLVALKEIVRKYPYTDKELEKLLKYEKSE